MFNQICQKQFFCYLDMLSCGLEVNNCTFPPLIKSCSILVPSSKLICHLVHAHSVKFGFCNDPFVVSAMIEFYSLIHDMETARMVFDRNPERDVVMWTGMIDGYGKIGDIEKARDLFEKMPERNVISWSAIMAAYSRASEFQEVLCLFRRMQEAGMVPNESVLVSVLTVCAHLGAISQGLWLHSYAKRFNLDGNSILATALVDMYSKCGLVDSALSVFEDIVSKDAEARNAMISGVAMNGDARKSLELFYKMVSSGLNPQTTFVALLSPCTHAKRVEEGLNLFARMRSVYGVEPQPEHYACTVLVSVLTVCAHLGAISQGLWLHSYAKRFNLDGNSILATALVDMYSKCGLVDSALSVFEDIVSKDAEARNAMISGVAMNGDARKSLELFYKMVSSGLNPQTTFVALLSPCTHAKRVEEGLNLFARMRSVYGVEPQPEHYACTVDLLARSGLVDEAEKFIEEKMGGLAGKDANVWGALLGACRIYGNVEVGNRVWKKLDDMDIADSSTHVLSHNIYKEAGWDMEANRVRKSILEAGMKKQPGCSVIELNGVIEEFLAGDIARPHADEAYKTLDSLFKLVNMENFDILLDVTL